MIKIIKSLYFSERFFYALFGFAALFLLSYWAKPIYPYIWLMVIAFVVIVFAEIVAQFLHVLTVNQLLFHVMYVRKRAITREEKRM